MSGHSKWATIKRQKGAADIKKGQIFTKIANAITIAVRNGGGVTDPESNFRLRLAIEKAREVNMPKENIQKAIARASGGDAKGLEEVICEGFTPGGVSVVIEAATDNSKRTTSEIKNLFRSVGGTFGQPGSVTYQFKQVGQIVVKKEGRTLDEIFEQVVECGAEDLEEKQDSMIIYTDYKDARKTRDCLHEKGFNIASVEIIRKPLVEMSVDDKDKLNKAIELLQKLEELDDVQKIYTNLKIY